MQNKQAFSDNVNAKTIDTMVLTFFEFEGKKYKLKYQKITTAEGELYQEMLFSQNVIGFSYIKIFDGKILFDNEFLEKQFQDLITHVIELREKRVKQKK